MREGRKVYCLLINIMEYNLDICIVQISDNILGLFFTTRSVHVHLLCSLQKKNKPYTIIAYLYVHTTSQ